MIARRASATPGSVKAQRSASAWKRSSAAITTSPRPCRRTMRGGPEKAQSINTRRPFSRRCATVSAPLPIMSR